MKRVIYVLLMLTMTILVLNQSSLAAGEGNIDGSGGGGMGSGSSGNKWSPGNDGVRITIIDARSESSVSLPVDFSNKTQPSSTIHFGKVSKIHYRVGASLSLQSGVSYSYHTPDIAMPRIVSSTGTSNISAVKRYFCSEYATRMVAVYTGFDYDRLISGEYKLLIEPIAYFTYLGNYYCMTATEAAIYDELSGGNLRSKMVSLSHKNLPLSMFLEYSDLGYSAWTGARTGARSNSEIINYLGLGIVKFNDIPDEIIAGELETPDVEYRTDTEVITSITLTAGSKLTPDDPASVTFTIDGRNYTVNNIVMPAGESQLVWVKWRTPSTPQELTIRVTVRGAYTLRSNFKANIVDIEERLPPDPLATDTNPSYTVPALPSNPEKTTAQWGVWSCRWDGEWIYFPDGAGGGTWRDIGEWTFEYTGYSASINAVMSLMPDDIVPTASGKNMKSGYAVKTDVTAVITTDAPESAYTPAQTANSVFSEFRYVTYNRLLKPSYNSNATVFNFKENPYSTYNRSVHFTPVWYPDYKQYTVYVQVWDIWTPAGMLSANISDHVNINGSLYDDWYTSRD